MDVTTTTVDWHGARQALSAASRRVAGLLRQVRDPKAPGTDAWNAAETAAHLSHSIAVNLNTARGPARDALPPHLRTPVAEVVQVSDFNAANLGTDPERDLGVLSARIEETSAAFLEETADAAGDEPVLWLGGAKLPLSALACHWVGESLLHGLDIARGSELPWTIEPAWAALTFAGLFVPAIGAFDPRASVDQEKADGLEACVEMRVRGAGRVLFVLEDGALRVESPSSRRAACHISTDAVTNFLLTWERISPLKAMARGRIVVWGRKPWQALQLTRALRMP